MKSNYKILIFYAVLIAVIFFSTATLLGGQPNEKLVYSDIDKLFYEQQVKVFEIDKNNKLTIEKQDGEVVSFTLRDLDLFWRQFGEIIEEQLHDDNPNTIESYNIAEPQIIPWWVSLLPGAVVIVLFIIFWIFIANQTAGGKGGKPGSFGKARAKLGSDEKKKVFFKDVAGADEEKAELQEVVEFLRDPAKFTKLGAHIPHGVLLVGPPGTGKTLLAKAVAGEAGVPFYSISGSDFVEMYVGVGASRVRDLFDTAKRNPASIIFIDEIDAVGRHRGAGLGGGHDEREQTLNQLLVEMDGFGGNEGVIVMAATNRPDILDPALLRPGRFDRQITVNYPDQKGRVDILKVHAKGKPFEEDVDLETLAKTTVGFTGADLENLLNEAALLAARRNKSLIGMDDLEQATVKVIVGPHKKSKKVHEEDKRIVAYHEAGHAIVTKLLLPNTSVHQISIIPAGSAAGYTLPLPKEDRDFMSKSEMEHKIAELLGGRVAEKVVIGDITAGASNDIQRATNMARNMVTRYGMSDILGPIVYGSEHGSDEVFLGRDFNSSRNYSEDTATLIDNEIKRLVNAANDIATKLLTENIDKLHFVAEFLMKNEVMDADQFNAAMDGNPTIEELEELAAAKKRKSAAENETKAKENEEARKQREAEEAKKAEENTDNDDRPRMKE